ncbi:MAG: hypothetical protein HZA01_11140 [Nitrospinae bacterium]|nr:hypothetical protein [Nitrospinota bacterium]
MEKSNLKNSSRRWGTLIYSLIFVFCVSALSPIPALAEEAPYGLTVLARKNENIPGLGKIISGGNKLINPFWEVKMAYDGVIAFTTALESLGPDTTALVRYDPKTTPNFKLIASWSGAPKWQGYKTLIVPKKWDITDSGDVYYGGDDKCSLYRAARGKQAEVFSSFCGHELPYPDSTYPPVVVTGMHLDQLAVAGGIPYIIADVDFKTTPDSVAYTIYRILKLENGTPSFIGNLESYPDIQYGGEDGQIYNGGGGGGIYLPLTLTPGGDSTYYIGRTIVGQYETFYPKFEFPTFDNIDYFAVGFGKLFIFTRDYNNGATAAYTFDGASFARIEVPLAGPLSYPFGVSDSAHAVEVLDHDTAGAKPFIYVFSTEATPALLFKGGQLAKYKDKNASLVARSFNKFPLSTPQNFDGRVAFAAQFDFEDGTEYALAIAEDRTPTCSADPVEIPETKLNGGEMDSIDAGIVTAVRKSIASANSALASPQLSAERAKELRAIIKALNAELRSLTTAKLSRSSLTGEESQRPDYEKANYVNEARCSGLEGLKDGLKQYASSKGLKPGEFVEGIDGLLSFLNGELKENSPKTDKTLDLLIKAILNTQFGGEAKDLASEALKMRQLVKKGFKVKKPSREIGKEAENLAKTLLKSYGKTRYGKAAAGAFGEIGRGIIVIAETIYNGGTPADQYEVVARYVETLAEKFFMDAAKDNPAVFAALFGYALTKPIAESIDRDLNVVLNLILADQCLRVLEKAQSVPAEGDQTIVDGNIGSFSCAVPRAAQITRHSLPTTAFEGYTCTLHKDAAIESRPGHCLVEIEPPSTFWNGFMEYFGKGKKKKYFDAAYVNRRSQ